MIKKKLVVLTGAGISAESGVKTFRDYDGLWEGYDINEVATPKGFAKNPKLVLDFYNQRRRELSNVNPNKAHYILCELEDFFEVQIITQNVDDLHERAGSNGVLHLHGELKKACSVIDKNKSFEWLGDINLGDLDANGNQIRPFIVWFGEDVPAIEKAIGIVADADIFVVVGTSLQVYPAAGLLQCVNEEVPIFYVNPNPASIDGCINPFEIVKEVATVGMKKVQKKLMKSIKL